MNQSRKIESVAMIGLGKMGIPLSGHIARAGYRVGGYDISPASIEAAKKAGITTYGSIKELSAASDFIIVLVGFDSEVEEVMFGKDGVVGAARPGSIIGVSSTVAPHTMQKLEKKLAGTGLALIDIPTCRGEDQAQAGTLLIMGGGEDAAFEAARPVLATFAKDIFHLGGAGAGQVGKLVNNQILWACVSGNYEGLKLASALGISEEKIRPALVASSSHNWALASAVETKPMPWAEKDMSIVLKEADRARVSLPLSGAIKEIIKGVKQDLGWPTPAEPDA
jgi:3-hydroxyisobutyrate dehydrogenase-like beta-hydroxyacid dehydrogenase